MTLTAALLHGSLRWDILKGIGRSHEARHDVGLELQESLPPDSALPELAGRLQAVGHAPWSASVQLGNDRWALALIEVPSGPGHPRLAVELLALRVEHTRLLNAGNGQLQSWVLSVAREGAFDLAQRDLPESSWLKTDFGAASPELGLFFGSQAAYDANLSEQRHLLLSLACVHAGPPFYEEVGDGVERLGWEVGWEGGAGGFLAGAGWCLAR